MIIIIMKFVVLSFLLFLYKSIIILKNIIIIIINFFCYLTFITQNKHIIYAKMGLPKEYYY